MTYMHNVFDALILEQSLHVHAVTILFRFLHGNKTGLQTYSNVDILGGGQIHMYVV